MNKADLLNSMSEKSGLLKKDTEKALAGLISSIEEALENGDKVQLVGFGTFEVKTRSERKGRNPQTMQEMVIPATKVPVFKAGKEFRERVK